MCCLPNCKAFGGSRVKTRRCKSRQDSEFFQQTCVLYLIVRPSVGPGLRLEVEDLSGGKKMYFEQTCVVCLIVRPGSRVKTRRRISRQEDVF